MLPKNKAWIIGINEVIITQKIEVVEATWIGIPIDNHIGIKIVDAPKSNKPARVPDFFIY